MIAPLASSCGFTSRPPFRTLLYIAASSVELALFLVACGDPHVGNSPWVSLSSVSPASRSGCSLWTICAGASYVHLSQTRNAGVYTRQPSVVYIHSRCGRGLGVERFRDYVTSLTNSIPYRGRTLRNITQCLMSQQFLLRRECMDKLKSLLQQNQTEIGEVMLLPGCTLTETYRILTDPRRSPTFQRVMAKSTRTFAACATCTQ